MQSISGHTVLLLNGLFVVAEVVRCACEIFLMISDAHCCFDHTITYNVCFSWS